MSDFLEITVESKNGEAVGEHADSSFKGRLFDDDDEMIFNLRTQVSLVGRFDLL